MEKIIEEKFKQFLENLIPLIDENGVKISGNGVIINELNKVNESLKNLDKKLYFLEKRQQEMFEHMKTIQKV
jgi:hypothetical protein